MKTELKELLEKVLSQITIQRVFIVVGLLLIYCEYMWNTWVYAYPGILEYDPKFTGDFTVLGLILYWGDLYGGLLLLLGLLYITPERRKILSYILVTHLLIRLAFWFPVEAPLFEPLYDTWIPRAVGQVTHVLVLLRWPLAFLVVVRGVRKFWLKLNKFRLKYEAQLATLWGFLWKRAKELTTP